MYEELTKNQPRRGKWFGTHKMVDEAEEREAAEKAV
jgi:hypothetical protein